MRNILLLTLLCFCVFANAQNVGIGTSNPDASAKLQIDATDKGLLIPRVSLSALNNASPITTPVTSLLVYNDATSGVAPNEVTPGYYYWDGTKWVRLIDVDASDDDLYKSGTTEAPTSISDSIYTEGTVKIGSSGAAESTLHITSTLQDETSCIKISSGGSNSVMYNSADGDFIIRKFNQTDQLVLDADGDVGIGTNNPDEKLEVYPGADNSAIFGNTHIGFIGHNNWAGFSHIDRNSQNDYALLQNTDGRTLLNSAAGEPIHFKNDNALQFEMEADGDLSMLDDNSIKMSNNIVYVEDWGTSTGYVHDGWRNVTGQTAWLNVENGNILKANFNLSTRLDGGSGTDDFTFRIQIDGRNGCADGYTEELFYRPNEDGSDHDNFKPVSYLDIVPVTCNGQYRFRIQVYNSGDDDFEVRDRALVVTKY